MRSLIITVLLAGFLQAGNNLTSGFEFLRTDFTPRTAAMSGAFIGLRSDVNALFVNPAGLAYLEERQYAFNYTNYLLDINGGSAAYAHLLPKIGVVSVGLTYMNYGDFDETDENAIKTGQTFTANDLAFSIGVSNFLDEHFSYGVAAKYIFSKIHDYTASAVALDFGLIYQAPFQDELFFAFTLRNVGHNFDYYAGSKESLPLSLGIGFTKRLAHLPLEFAAGFNDLNQDSDQLTDRLKRFSLGGEFRFSEMIRLRLGYNNQLHNDLETGTSSNFGGVSGGLGIYWRAFRFDYAYSNFGGLGATHRIGISGVLE